MPTAGFRIKASEETIWKSLEGTWRAEHILTLKQRLSPYRSHGAPINECDREIVRLVAAFEPKVDPEVKPLPEVRKQKQRKRKRESGSPEFVGDQLKTYFLNAGPTGIGAGRLGRDQSMNFADRGRRIGTAFGAERNSAR